MLNHYILRCLSTLADLKQHSIPRDMLGHFEELNENFSFGELRRLAASHGFSMRLGRKPLTQINQNFFPVIILLKPHRACILESIDTKRGIALIRYPNKKEASAVSLASLNKLYTNEYIELGTIEQAPNYQSKSKSPTSHWFWQTLWQFKSIFKHVILAALIINVLSMAIPLFMMNVYDRVIPNNAVETLWVLSSGVILAAVFDFFLKTLRAYLVDVANKAVDLDVSSKLLAKMMNTTLEEQPKVAGIGVSQLKEFDSVRDFFASLTLVALVDLPFLFVFITAIGLIGGPLCLVTFIASIVALSSSFALSIPLRRHLKNSVENNMEKTALLFESLTSIELIKTNSAQNEVLDRWQKQTSRAADHSLTTRYLSVLAVNLTGLITSLAVICSVIFGVYLIKASLLTVGGLIACILLTSRALAPLSQTTTLITKAQQIFSSMKVLNKIMAAKEEHQEDKKYFAVEQIHGAIEFNHVSFGYPEQKQMLLKNLNFSIKPGEKVAILGSTGAGKSTLLKLILGLYQPSRGNIRLDGVNIKQIDPWFLRNQLGYLEQSPDMLFGTALENVTMREPNARQEKIIEALEVSGAQSFLKQHIDGADLKVTSGGKQLSGGQRQMIALSRAILDDPPILLLDEPTSFMDHQSEMKVLEQLRPLVEDKTLIVVTHKQALLGLVDRVIFIKDGKIVKDEHKQALFNKPGKKVSQV